MSQESVEKFLGRLLTDDGFRKRAKDYLLMSCVKNGYILTESEQKILQSVDFKAFASLSDNIDSEIKRYSVK